MPQGGLPKFVQVRIQDDGRVHIPRSVLRDVGWELGEIVLMTQAEGELRLLSMKSQIDLVQQRFEALRGDACEQE